MNKLVCKDILDSSLMISTDLDGTLLDHHTYSWLAAKPALEMIKHYQIPIVINSSKTEHEVLRLRKDLDIDAPFIVENGSALFLPKKQFSIAPIRSINYGDFWKIIFGCSRMNIVEQLRKIRRRYRWDFSGFSDWDSFQLMAYTELDNEGAQLALNRAYSEPILWRDTKENFKEFRRQIALCDLQILQGGRFFHILGITDKSIPLKWLSQYFKTLENRHLKWIVLGDSENDIDMLKIAKFPVAVKSPVGDYPNFNGAGATIFTNDFGPAGWNRAILDILESFTKQQ